MPHWLLDIFGGTYLSGVLSIAFKTITALIYLLRVLSIAHNLTLKTDLRIYGYLTIFMAWLFCNFMSNAP